MASRSLRRLRLAARREEGQSLVLAIGLCAITLLTISVVLAASAVNLKARQLLSLADGAIVAAVDEFEFVADGGAPRIQLSADQVQQGARRYLADVGASGRVDNLGIASVHVLPGDRAPKSCLPAPSARPSSAGSCPPGSPLPCIPPREPYSAASDAKS